MRCSWSGRAWAPAPARSWCPESGPRKRLVHGDPEAVELLVVASTEVHAVRQHDEREVLRWIDPHARPGEPGVPECVLAEKRQALRWAKHQADAATDAAASILLGPCEVAELVPDDGAIAVHADDRGNIRSGAEQAGVSRYAAHRIRVLVMDFASQALAAPLAVLFGRRALCRGTRAEFAGSRFDHVEP